MTTIAEALASATDQLNAQQVDAPELEASLLLGEATGKPRTYFIAWPERELSSTHLHRFNKLLSRRLEGMPVAYILGRREFWSLELQVTPDTLIPRPETELLVELALEHIPESESWSVLDLGTGSGAIAAAIASERPDCSIVATDYNPETLEIAKANFKQLRLDNVTTKTGNWYQALADTEKFNLIISNPPYIGNNDPHLHAGDLPHEPQQALVSGKDGLDDIRLITAGAQEHLHPSGLLMMEHGYTQGPGVRKIFEKHGFASVHTHKDLSENDRATIGRRAN